MHTQPNAGNRVGPRPWAVAGAIALLPVLGAAWLFLVASPALADGGPHVLAGTNGQAGISADICSTCHRAHTSQNPAGFVLVGAEANVTNFCRSCHGAAGTGATTNVDNGVQYALNANARGDVVLGALRSGGFLSARIGSDAATRTRFSSVGTRDFLTKVPVGAPAPVTSAHLALPGSDLTSTNMTWGYGPIAESNAGTIFKDGLQCTSCHNPHGNGNYRILNAIPTDDGLVAPPSGVSVYDAPLPAPGDTRNYTVIQVKGTQGNNASFLLYASQLAAYSSAAGDYFHRYVPWNSASGANDAPNGRQASGFVNGTLVKDFDSQMEAWCSTCHTRYHNTDGPSVATGDGIFAYQHVTNGNRGCTTCHVAHGTNAVMNTNPATGTTFSANVPFPGQTSVPPEQVGNSRLLKIDGRGTCLACHDPTNTITVGTSQGPVPNPLTP